MDRYATLRDGLIGAWCPSLNASGYILPSVVRQHSLTHNGTITAAPGGGKGLDLTTNQYAELENSGLLYGDPVNATEFTWSMWVRMRSFPNAYNQIAETYTLGTPNVYQASCLIKSNGKLAFYIVSSLSPRTDRSYDGSGAFTLAANTWYHIAYVWRAGVTQSGYVNGILDGSASIPADAIATPLSPAPIAIGRSTSGTRNLNGWLDDVRFYRRALTVSELRILASQRGIGLVPTRRRRANVLGSQFWLRDAGTWKKATGWINVGGVWTKATPKINVSGTWK